MACLPASSPADAACAPASPAFGRRRDPRIVAAMARAPFVPCLDAFPFFPGSAPRPHRRSPRPRAAPRRGASLPPAAGGSSTAVRWTGAAPLGGGERNPAHWNRRGRRAAVPGARSFVRRRPRRVGSTPGKRAGCGLGGAGRECRGPRHRPWGLGESRGCDGRGEGGGE